MFAQSSRWIPDWLEYYKAMMHFLDQVQPILPIILAFIFGTLIGSFSNVLIWRLPREESIQGRSHCPHCNHQLVWHDLIPVISLLLQRARCKYCGKRVSLRYPFIEVLVGTLFALTIWLFPVTDLASGLIFAKVAIAVLICVIVFVIDLEHYLILDRIVFPAMLLMLAFSIAMDLVEGGFRNTLMSVGAGLAAFIPFWLLWFGSKWFAGSEGKWMGYGDVKFAAFMGLALGFPGIAIALFLSFILGALVGVGLILIGKKQFSSKLPFGTFLSFATILALFWGYDIWQAYWSLFLFA